MKALFVISLCSISLISNAQNFSPAAGATSQTSPGTLGAGTTLTSPSSVGSSLTSPSTSAITTEGIQPNSGVSESAPQINGSVLTPPSSINPSPNPVPGESNTSDTFDTSLILGIDDDLNTMQAEEAEPGTTNQVPNQESGTQEDSPSSDLMNSNN